MSFTKMVRDVPESPYDVIADEYDRAFGPGCGYYDLITQRERELFDKWVPQATSVTASSIDIGCGTGFHTEWLVGRGYRVVGVDSSKRMLDVAERKFGARKGRVTFKLQDASRLHRLECPEADVVLCFGSTINHVADWDAVLSGASRKIRSGGMLLLNFDNLRGIDTLFWLLKRGRNIYAGKGARRKLLRKALCAVRGRPFSNHLHMEIGGKILELPLTYESPNGAARRLRKAGFEPCDWSGAHLATALDRRLMESSAFIEDAVRVKESCVSKCVRRIDSWLSRYFWRGAANVLVAARKGRKPENSKES